jgi:hypothetical protein
MKEEEAAPVRAGKSKSQFPLKQIDGLGARIKSTFST